MLLLLLVVAPLLSSDFVSASLPRLPTLLLLLLLRLPPNNNQRGFLSLNASWSLAASIVVCELLWFCPFVSSRLASSPSLSVYFEL